MELPYTLKLGSKQNDQVDGPARLIEQHTGGILRDIMILIVGASIQAIEQDLACLSPSLLAKTWHYIQEQTFLSPVQSAIDHLKAEGILPTQAKVCGLVGIPTSTLPKYPRITALIATAAIEFYLDRQRQLQQQQEALRQQSPLDPRESALVEAVQVAIKRLKADDKLVPQKAIAQLVGLHHDHLRRYPQISLIFEQRNRSPPGVRPELKLRANTGESILKYAISVKTPILSRF